MLGVALNEVFVPLLQKQFPEIVDFYLPPEGLFLPPGGGYYEETVCRACQTGDDGRLVLLRQFMYTKFVIVCDDDINARDWKDVIWAITTRMDPARDTVLVENTPIDYLDFASPVSGSAPKWGWMPPINGRARRSENGVTRLLKTHRLSLVWMPYGTS